jgi:hypothetical protein
VHAERQTRNVERRMPIELQRFCNRLHWTLTATPSDYQRCRPRDRDWHPDPDL